MAVQNYIYQDRIVAFLDVLGFQEKLIEFEQDAIAKKSEEGLEYLVSEKVNEFINTVKDVIGLLDDGNFRYYLFSDNICITVDYIENPELLITVLFTINELFYSFAQKGYFLRGGIDIGKFVDEKQVALGVPLARAYLMESKDAVYPRILVSNNYYKLLEENLAQKKLSHFENLNSDLIINESCEFYYLNVFYHVVKKEDKAKYFSDLKTKILENIEVNKKKEKVYVKYSWLANEYNKFLSLYANDLIYRQEDFEPTEEIIDELKSLKIELYAI